MYKNKNEQSGTEAAAVAVAAVCMNKKWAERHLATFAHSLALLEREQKSLALLERAKVSSNNNNKRVRHAGSESHHQGRAHLLAVVLRPSPSKPISRCMSATDSSET